MEGFLSVLTTMKCLPLFQQPNKGSYQIIQSFFKFRCRSLGFLEQCILQADYKHCEKQFTGLTLLAVLASDFLQGRQHTRLDLDLNTY